MISPRRICHAGLLDGKLYVAGGVAVDGEQCLRSMECFDPETQQWSNAPPMSSPKSSGGATVLDGKLYVAGGYNAGTRLRSVECFDPATQRWSAAPSLQHERTATCMVLAAAEEELPLLGVPSK